MQPIIKVENLGKSYIIGHQREKYVALRDVLANKARQMVSKTKNILSGGQLIAGNELEEFWALKDINFEVNQGDRVGIIGRNGAGKSTLLKVLSRITEPTTGRIHLKGRVASLLEVGTGFHPELSGRENIYLNGAILGMSRAEVRKKFDEIVDFAGVEKFLDTPVKRYSSGMYVRLAFAVAAHLEPEILIVDEVLAVGDAEFQKKCLGKMEDVSKNQGRTVLFVSHNMGAIATLCSKGIVLENGRVVFNGNASDSIENYSKGNPVLNSKIIEGLRFCHADIQIESIKINGSENSVVHLDRDKPSLNIVIEGLLLSDKSMSFGLTIYDMQNVKLAVFCPGHVKNKTYTLTKGSFKIEETVHLPLNIAKGEYRLNLGLDKPNIEVYLEIQDSVRLISPGITGVTGLEFAYQNNGFLILE